MMKRFIVINFFLVPICLLGISLNVDAAKGKLMAGTAKINITPVDSAPVHDSLYARALVLSVNDLKIAFVAVDQGIYTSDEVELACRQKYGIDQVFISSSHTHSGGKRNEEFVSGQIIDVVGLALEDKFQATIAAGHRSFPQLGFNRLIVREDGHARESWFSDDHYTSENPERIPFGPVDPEVGVIKISDTKGNPRAILMNYAMHADIVCSNFEISADYPGVASRKVEEAFDNKLNCLFVPGAGGDIESLIISSRRKGPDDSFKSDYRTIERVGELLAWEAIKLTNSLDTPQSPDVDLRYLNDSLHFTGRFKEDVEYNLHVSTILINESIVIGTCPGEPFVRLQIDLKRKIREAGGTPFLFGYTWYQGTWPNYLPDIQSAARGGYGADQSWPEPFAIGAGETIMNKLFENYFRLNGMMRNEPGPVGFKAGSQWETIEIPAEK